MGSDITQQWGSVHNWLKLPISKAVGMESLNLCEHIIYHRALLLYCFNMNSVKKKPQWITSSLPKFQEKKKPLFKSKGMKNAPWASSLLLQQRL